MTPRDPANPRRQRGREGGRERSLARARETERERDRQSDTGRERPRDRERSARSPAAPLPSGRPPSHSTPGQKEPRCPNLICTVGLLPWPGHIPSPGIRAGMATSTAPHPAGSRLYFILPTLSCRSHGADLRLPVVSAQSGVSGAGSLSRCSFKFACL